uniref:Sodium-dependent phosphate transport protein 2B n=2 Tax=Magallana gigas TaxID=29159 RepID=A0A8W8KAT1_MAGGI|nr:sodium-dependent phosphate transport protein 2B [Crassostrea gigas]
MELENTNSKRLSEHTKSISSEQNDPWAVSLDLKETTTWKELSTTKRTKLLVSIFVKTVVLLVFVYFFICALGFLTDAFQLLGGEANAKIFKENEVLSNPVAGLMIGILATALIQSSSTTISIVIALAGSKTIPVRDTIPMIMGSNIGTTVTNTIVSLAQAGSREEFRKAFGGATIHDVFNWMCVIVLLPIEVISGYLFHLTKAIVDSLDISGSSKTKRDLLKTITKPFIRLFVQIDKTALKCKAIHVNGTSRTVLKRWCGKVWTSSNADPCFPKNVTGDSRCKNLFALSDLNDEEAGLILTIAALLLIVLCLFVVVKLLNSLFKGTMASIVKRFINADFPGKFGWLTGYVAILIGAGMTMIIQSSSVFTSTLTPLVGVGIVSMERMFPLTIGANIGTTVTGILAALAVSESQVHLTLQVALCHLFFNLSGTVLFYPIPFLRKIPIYLAKSLGNSTAQYRWFAIVYLVGMFFLLPAAFFALSQAGPVVFMAVGIPFLTVLVIVILVNLLQVKAPQCLPKQLRTWNFLPSWLHSLEPYDRVISKIMCMKCCRNQGHKDDFKI